MSAIRHVRIDVAPVNWSIADSYCVRIDVQSRAGTYSREQLIPAGSFGSHFDSFVTDAVESIREEIERDATVQIGIPTL
jgi:hypothetical protein